MIKSTLVKTEIHHADFNLEDFDNLKTIPAKKAVFAVFALLHGQAINCRYVDETDNLYVSVKELFENPPENGLNYFMQGPWIKMLQYQLMPETTQEQRISVVEDWEKDYKPNIEDTGEYPGYSNYK